MPNSPTQSYFAFTTTGAAAGAGMFQVVGGIGVVGMGTGFGVGLTPMMVTGAVVGSAAHELLRGWAEGDPNILGAGVLGGIGGASFYSVVGGIGVSVGGGAVGLGLTSFVTGGAILGLAAYGFYRAWKPKPGERLAGAFDAFNRIEAKLNDQLDWQFNYIQALLELEEELSGEALERKFRLLEADIELEEMKAKLRSHHQPATPKTPASPPPAEPIDTIAAQPDQAWHCVQTWKAHNAEINGLAISADGQTLASASSDRTINLWRFSTQKLIFSFFCSQEPYAIAIAPDNQTLISGDLDQKVTRWSITNKTMLQTFFSRLGCPTSHNGFVYAIAISRDNQTVVSGGADNTVRLWQLGSGRLIRILNGHTNTVWSVVVHPDGATCASASADQTIRIWQMTQPIPSPWILTGHTASVNAIALTPNGQVLISGSADTTIKYWDYQTGTLLKTLTGHKAAIFSVAISPDGETLASSDRAGCTKIWHLPTGEPLQSFASLGPVLFSPNGQFLITSGTKGHLKLWQRRLTSSSPAFITVIDGEWWEVLGVEPNASPQEVKRAYRDRVKQYHPDINPLEAAQEIMQILNKAYESFERSH